MKIMLCCRSSTAICTGGMEVVYDLRAEELRRQGHEVLQVTAPDGSYSDAYAKACSEAAVRFGPEILHLDSFDDKRPWWREHKKGGRCVSCTIHGQLWGWRFTEWNQFVTGHREAHERSWDGLKANACMQKDFDRLLTISKWEWLMARMLIGRSDARLVHNPISRRFFETAPSGALRGGFMALATRWPGEAIEAAKRADKALVMVKGCPPEQMPWYYDAATAFVLPTYNSQGFDLTIAEALARRCPVIAYSTGSVMMAELPGIVKVPMDDVQALADAMKRPLPEVPPDAAAGFHPETHVRNWLEALA